MKTTLAFLCLAAGVAGLAIGVSGDARYFIPGAILVGAAVIAMPNQDSTPENPRRDAGATSRSS